MQIGAYSRHRWETLNRNSTYRDTNIAENVPQVRVTVLELLSSVKGLSSGMSRNNLGILNTVFLPLLEEFPEIFRALAFCLDAVNDRTEITPVLTTHESFFHFPLLELD